MPCSNSVHVPLLSTVCVSMPKLNVIFSSISTREDLSSPELLQIWRNALSPHVPPLHRSSPFVQSALGGVIFLFLWYSRLRASPFVLITSMLMSLSQLWGVWQRDTGSDPKLRGWIANPLLLLVLLLPAGECGHDVGVTQPRLIDFSEAATSLMSALIVGIVIKICVTLQRPMWLGIVVREGSQGLAWVFGLKPQCWVPARWAVIPANYSQGLHLDSHWRGSHSHLAHFSKLQLA